MVVTKKQHKFGSATEESVLPPKTNDNGIGTMSFISVSPSLPLCIPSPPTRRAEKGLLGGDYEVEVESSGKLDLLLVLRTPPRELRNSHF